MDGAEWRNIGCTQLASGKFHAAIAAFLRAHGNGQDSAEFHREFANALWGAGDRDAAMAEIHQASEKDPASFAIAANVANFLAALGEYEGAAKWLKRAILINPEPRAKFNRAIYLLASGDWEHGWREWDSRFDLFPLDHPQKAGVPLWTGQDLGGKLIWITCEQGQGDQIQFSRYVPWVKSLGAGVIFDSHAELVDFSIAARIPTRNCGPAGHYHIPADPQTGKKPDFHCPLMSLPSRHKTTPKTVPPVKWYTDVAKEHVVSIPGDPGKTKIGLVWAGSKDHPGDHLRSIPLQSLLPLTGNDACEFYSFQVGERAGDIEECGAQPLMHALPLRLWSQTVAALVGMDALVTVDTSCAHMAASLGIKTLMMVSTEPDWRWGTEGETTPWYPAMTIIRQQARGDWAGVVRRVADEITRL